jgi:hypothetical protein
MKTGRCLLCAGEESESDLLLKCSETEVGAGVPEEQMASYQNLRDLTYKIRCKYEDRVKKEVLRLGEGEELDST